MLKCLFFVLLVFLVIVQPAFSQKTSSEKEKKDKFKAYEKVIPKNAISNQGLFSVHQVDDNYFFEIPFSLLNKDMLIVTRLVKVPTPTKEFHAGKKTNETLVNWVRYKDKILIKRKDKHVIVEEDDPLKKSVDINHYAPTLYTFDIEAFGKDSTSAVIDVTKFFGKDIDGMSISDYARSMKLKGLENSSSHIDVIKSFPKNIEVRQNFTYRTLPPSFPGNVMSVVVNQSMVLLPEIPMQARIQDDRLGWFSVRQTVFSSNQLKVEDLNYIKRWRLIPKDLDAYARGELVEPVKPIVFYIDAATPIKYRPYFKEGIELWQKAFEVAGFKNAIIAKDAPTKEENPDFSPEDVRYSVVRYIAATVKNASGPSVVDPRSGEIIESDILWYHNHLSSYRNRYMIETGAANPRARTLNTPIEDIGEMMKMVIAHEVGHALGLPHNFAASFAYDVENYRDSTFTQKNGVAASIMDYARFNYIAQPGDKGVRFIRQLGPYDIYTINWGYRYYKQFDTPKEETPVLKKLIDEKTGNPWYAFSISTSNNPAAQREDISNNALKAGEYAISNLKVVAKNLAEWTSEKTNDYDDLVELHQDFLKAYFRYIGHVEDNIGGVYIALLNPNQQGAFNTPVSQKTQREAVDWLHTHLFTTPLWLFDASVDRSKISAQSISEILKMQSAVLRSLVSKQKLENLTDYYQKNSDNYSPTLMINDLHTGIWKELHNNDNVDIYRRNLQKAYLNEFVKLFNDNPGSELQALALGELQKLKLLIEEVRKRGLNEDTKLHYQVCLMTINKAITGKG